MSQMPLHDSPGVSDPERILRRLPEAERERFLSDYRTALNAAHACDDVEGSA